MNEDYHYEVPEASEEDFELLLEAEELRKELERIRNDPVVIQKSKEFIEANRETYEAKREARQKEYEEERRNPIHSIRRDALRAISKAAGEALLLLELDPSYARGFLGLMHDAWSFEEEE